MARRRKKSGRLLRIAVGVPLLAAAAFAGWKALTWPDVPRLARENPESTAFIDRFVARERAAGREGTVARRPVPYEAISPHLKRAVLVAEDINFFTHSGFEVHEIKEAVTKAVKEREPPRGASTITQQLAKNLWLSPSRNPLRKIEEAILTKQLERSLSKKRILELYLNVVEFGPGIYGAEAAARRYYGKPAAALTEWEAARLAAALPKPSSWHPEATSRAAARRAELIRSRMAKATFLSKQI